MKLIGFKTIFNTFFFYFNKTEKLHSKVRKFYNKKIPKNIQNKLNKN